jgi:hypothetical protein
VRRPRRWLTRALQEYNDVLLTSYLASMTKGLHSLNEVSRRRTRSLAHSLTPPQLVDKFDTAQSGRDELDAARGDPRSAGRSRKPMHAAGSAY